MPGGDGEPAPALDDEPAAEEALEGPREAAGPGLGAAADGENEDDDGEQQRLQGTALRNAWGSDDDDDDA